MPRRGKRFTRRIGHPGQSDSDILDIYLKEVGKTPLLTPAQEILLAKRIKQGDPDALEKLTKANLRFVISVAKQYQGQGLDLSDLVNEGNLGLIKAAKRFDETRGFKFISYAVWWIRQVILQALAEQSRIVRIPLNRVGTMYKIGRISAALEQEFGREPSPDEVARELEISTTEFFETVGIPNSHLSLDAPFSEGEGTNTLLDVLEDENQEPPDQVLMLDALRIEIEKALDTLTPREAEVTNLYFGLSGEKALTLDDIGLRFNLTRERIRQVKERALRRLRLSARSKGLKPYVD